MELVDIVPLDDLCLIIPPCFKTLVKQTEKDTCIPDIPQVLILLLLVSFMFLHRERG